MTWIHRTLPTVLLVSACSAANSADSPVERGWQRLRTDHFTLTTDLEPALAQRAASSLEVTRAALLEAGWPRLGTTRQTQRVRVVVLKDRLEFGHYFGTKVSGLHAGGRLQTIVLYGAPEQCFSRACANRHDAGRTMATPGC